MIEEYGIGPDLDIEGLSYLDQYFDEVVNRFGAYAAPAVRRMLRKFEPDSELWAIGSAEDGEPWATAEVGDTALGISWDGRRWYLTVSDMHGDIRELSRDSLRELEQAAASWIQEAVEHENSNRRTQ